MSQSTPPSNVRQLVSPFAALRSPSELGSTYCFPLVDKTTGATASQGTFLLVPSYSPYFNALDATIIIDDIRPLVIQNACGGEAPPKTYSGGPFAGFRSPVSQGVVGNSPTRAFTGTATVLAALSSVYPSRTFRATPGVPGEFQEFVVVGSHVVPVGTVLDPGPPPRVCDILTGCTVFDYAWVAYNPFADAFLISQRNLGAGWAITSAAGPASSTTFNQPVPIVAVEAPAAHFDTEVTVSYSPRNRSYRTVIRLRADVASMIMFGYQTDFYARIDGDGYTTTGSRFPGRCFAVISGDTSPSTLGEPSAFAIAWSPSSYPSVTDASWVYPPEWTSSSAVTLPAIGHYPSGQVTPPTTELPLNSQTWVHLPRLLSYSAETTGSAVPDGYLVYTASTTTAASRAVAVNQTLITEGRRLLSGAYPGTNYAVTPMTRGTNSPWTWSLTLVMAGVAANSKWIISLGSASGTTSGVSLSGSVPVGVTAADFQLCYNPRVVGANPPADVKNVYPTTGALSDAVGP